MALINGDPGQTSSLGQVIVDLQAAVSARQTEYVFATAAPPLADNEIVLSDTTNVLHVPPAPVSGETYTRESFAVMPPSGPSDHARDMVLRIDCTGLDATQTPLVSWSDAFHPRADAETDLVPVPGELCVFYASEYAEGKYVVSQWVETTGGYDADGSSSS